MLNRLLVFILAVAMGFIATRAFAQQQAAQQRGGETTVAKQVAADNSAPLLLQAIDLIYDNRNNRVIARGNVEIYYNNYALLADEVIYDRSSNTLSAVGNVRIKEPDGALINADRITLKDDFRDGFIRSLKVVTYEEARIGATNAYRKDGDTTVYENGVFTPYKYRPEDPNKVPLWRVKAAKIIHKKDEQNLYYEDAQFEVFGVPAFYVPYFYMPDPQVKRRSGFLTPHFGNSTELGFSAAIPYYYSPSPNYDLTLTPEFTTKAGYLLQAEWRHKFVNGAYKVSIAGAYNDNADEFVENREFRGSIQTIGNFAINNFWSVGWNATLESDDTFRRFYKLDNIYATQRVSEVHLVGIGERNYFGAYLYRFGDLTDIYDRDIGIRRSIAADAYPVIDYNYVHDRPVLGGEFSFDVNAVNLTVSDARSGTGLPFRRDSTHVATQAQWRRSFTDSAGQVFTPFGQARGDIYSVSKFRDLDGDAGPDDTFTRQMVAGGIDYRYPFVAHTENASHVIEPVGQIIARSNVANNDKVPNEDSQSLVFDDTLLFDINKFSGYDRIETGTRANVGAQYTMQAYNGVSVRLVGGQSFQVAGKNSFDATTGLYGDQSDYVLGGYVDWRNQFRITSQLRLNESDFSVARQDHRIQTKLGFFQGAVSYVAVEAQPLLGFLNRREEVSGFAAFRLNDEWTLFGDVRYNITLGEFVRDSVGVQYSDEGFTLSVAYAETFIEYADLRPDRTFMVRYGLKFLGQQTVSDSIGDLSPEASVFK